MEQKHVNQKILNIYFYGFRVLMLMLSTEQVVDSRSFFLVPIITHCQSTVLIDGHGCDHDPEELALPLKLRGPALQILCKESVHWHVGISTLEEPSYYFHRVVQYLNMKQAWSGTRDAPGLWVLFLPVTAFDSVWKFS